MLTVRKIENVAVGPNSKPKLPILISACGVRCPPPRGQLPGELFTCVSPSSPGCAGNVTPNAENIERRRRTSCGPASSNEVRLPVRPLSHVFASTLSLGVAPTGALPLLTVGVESGAADTSATAQPTASGAVVPESGSFGAISWLYS